VKIARIINKGIVCWKKCRRKGDNRELTVLLDKDSFERFHRLKSQIPAFGNNEIITLALKCLEQKIERITKRQIRIRNRFLENEENRPQSTSEVLKN
jgi:hypothetical protein